jgi:hypothetical protein
LVTDLLPAPPLPDVDAGVDVELDELPPALLLAVEVEVEVLLLLLPQAVAMIMVATSVANPTNPPRAPLVMSLLL